MRTYRASRSAYIIFAAFFAIPAAIGIFAAAKSPSAWQMVAISVAAVLIFWFWLSRFRLDISSDRLGYASLFRPDRSVQCRDIVEADLASETSRFEGPFTFVVKTSSGEVLRINAKVFSREAVRQLSDLAPKRSNQRLQLTGSCANDSLRSKRCIPGS